MTARLFQFSGVVVGQAHNPTILNPDFLAAEGIVPKSWNWSVSETITTPPLAMVRYANGATITWSLLSRTNCKSQTPTSKTDHATAKSRRLRPRTSACFPMCGTLPQETTFRASYSAMHQGNT